MTRDELKDLACLGFSADLVMQSFCHTAAYPKPVDVVTHATLPDFIRNRGGVSLRPGDGVIHSWLNRMLLPDTVRAGWGINTSPFACYGPRQRMDGTSVHVKEDEHVHQKAKGCVGSSRNVSSGANFSSALWLIHVLSTQTRHV